MQLLNIDEMELFNKRLDEFFTLPSGLEQVATYKGSKMYTSDKLKSKYIKAMEKNGRTKAITPILQKMMDKGTFIPAYINKNVFKLMAYRFGPDTSRKHIAGFFSLDYKVIILIIDNNTKWGFTSDDFMALLTVHEGMHMAAFTQKAKFISIFLDDLANYYYEVFKEIFSLKDRPKKMKDIVKYIFYKIEAGRIDNRDKMYVEYFEYLVKNLSKHTSLEKNAFEKLARDWVVCIKLYWSNPMIVYRNRRTFAHILNPIARAYKTVWGKIPPYNFFVQEIGVPSEVIAVRSELVLDSKTYTCFRLLA